MCTWVSIDRARVYHHYFLGAIDKYQISRVFAFARLHEFSKPKNLRKHSSAASVLLLLFYRLPLVSNAFPSVRSRRVRLPGTGSHVRLLHTRRPLDALRRLLLLLRCPGARRARLRNVRHRTGAAASASKCRRRPRGSQEFRAANATATVHLVALGVVDLAQMRGDVAVGGAVAAAVDATATATQQRIVFACVRRGDSDKNNKNTRFDENEVDEIAIDYNRTGRSAFDVETDH